MCQRKYLLLFLLFLPLYVFCQDSSLEQDSIKSQLTNLLMKQNILLQNLKKETQNLKLIIIDLKKQLNDYQLITVDLNQQLANYINIKIQQELELKKQLSLITKLEQSLKNYKFFNNVLIIGSGILLITVIVEGIIIIAK